MLSGWCGWLGLLQYAQSSIAINYASCIGCKLFPFKLLAMLVETPFSRKPERGDSCRDGLCSSVTCLSRSGADQVKGSMAGTTFRSAFVWRSKIALDATHFTERLSPARIDVILTAGLSRGRRPRNDKEVSLCITRRGLVLYVSFRIPRLSPLMLYIPG